MELRKKKDKNFGKGKEKERRVYRSLEKNRVKKKQDTIEDEDPHNKHTIEDQCCSWATPLKNSLGAVVLLDFKKASYILRN